MLLQKNKRGGPHDAGEINFAVKATESLNTPIEYSFKSQHQMKTNSAQEDAARQLVRFISESQQMFRLRECRRYCQYSESANLEKDKGRSHHIDDKRSPDFDPKDRDCVCGRKMSQHSKYEEQMKRADETYFEHGRALWELHKNTYYVESNSYGEIVFHDAINPLERSLTKHGEANPIVEGARSKYLRLVAGNNNQDEYMDLIVNKLMLGLWAMPEPRLIIEVTGTTLDSEIETVESNVVKTLKEGIVKAARDANAWIVTGGSNSGVMRLIGDEAAKYHRLDQIVPCLGIATWGCLRGRDALATDELYVDYNIEHTPSPLGEFSLNHGHNYYLLVDNAREKIFGEEIEFRHDLINYTAKTMAAKLPTKEPAPIVMLALGGGIGTLQTLEDCFGIPREAVSNDTARTSPKSPKSLSGDNKVVSDETAGVQGTKPVIILYGFGGATDLLADVYMEFVVNKSHVAKIELSQKQFDELLTRERTRLEAEHEKKVLEQERAAALQLQLERIKTAKSDKSGSKVAFSSSKPAPVKPSNPPQVPDHHVSNPALPPEPTSAEEGQENREPVFEINISMEVVTEESIIKENIKAHQLFSRLSRSDADENTKQNMVERIYRCYEVLKNRPELLTVHRCSSDNTKTLNENILESALNNNHNPILALQLARLWQATDAAREILKKRQNEIIQKIEGHAANALISEQLKELVQDAIVVGQSEFLSLLFDYKLVKAADYLRHSDVFAIYIKALERGPHDDGSDNYVAFLKSITKLSYTLSERQKMERHNWTRTELDGVKFVRVGRRFSSLIGCFCVNLFLEENFYQHDLDQCGLMDSKATDLRPDKELRIVQNQIGSDEDRKKQKHYLTKYRDVFLLQLALNQQQQADFLWKTGSNVIGTALAASIFLKNLAQLAKRKDRRGLADDYEIQSIKWERRAEQVLNECNEYRQKKVAWLLTRNLLSWQNRSVFEIAFYGRCMEFVKHEAVQIKLRHIWYGRVSAFTRPIWVYLAALFPIPFVWLLKFVPYDATGKEVKLPKLQKSQFQDQLASNNCKVSMSDETICFSCVPKSAVSPTDFTSPRSESGNVKPELFEENSLCRRNISFPEAMKSLWSASMVRFFFHVIFLFFFLLLFSSFILTCTLEPKVTVLEGFVLAWAACFLIDQVHEAYADDVAVVSKMKAPLKLKIGLFMRTIVYNRFNIFNWQETDFFTAIIPLIAGILLLISFILRMVLSQDDYVYPRTTYALTCLLFWLQALRVFQVTRTVGIIVTILSELLSTLFAFILVYIFLLLAFSIPLYALIAPKRGPVDMYNSTVVEFGVPVQQTSYRWTRQSMYDGVNSFFKILIRVIYNRWWNLVQFDTDNSRKSVEGICPSPDDGRSIASLPFVTYYDGSCDSEFNFVAVIIYIFFIFLTNIAWMNVLIATLSEEVSNIRKNAEKLSKFNYFVAVRTIYYRCYFPSPISLIEIIVRIIYFACRRSLPSRLLEDGKNTDFLDVRYKQDVQIKLDELERHCAEVVLRKAEREADAKSRFLDLAENVQDESNL